MALPAGGSGSWPTAGPVGAAVAGLRLALWGQRQLAHGWAVAGPVGAAVAGPVEAATAGPWLGSGWPCGGQRQLAHGWAGG